MTENELYHFGIKGQKWGIRRFQKKDGTLTSAGKKRSKTDGWSQDAKDAYNIKKKKVNQMSNAELRKLNERQNLERNYKSFNKNTIAKGIAFVGTAAAAIGTLNSLYNNSNNLIKNGQAIVNKLSKRSTELYHFGIKGMKWGVRRTPEQLGHKNKTSSSLQTADKHGKTAIKKYKSLKNRYDRLSYKAMKKNDLDEVTRLENELSERIEKEVIQPLHKAGYDYVDRGFDSNGTVTLQFGKYLDSPITNKYGGEDWVEEFMINSGSMKVYKIEDDW